MSLAGLLEIRRGDEVREFALTPPTLAIGRASDNPVALNDPQVSRHHARLDWSARGLQITDLGSSNGTRVNEVEIEPKVPQPLADGDTIRVGSFTLTLHLPQAMQQLAAISPIRAETFIPEQTLVPGVAPRLIVKTPQGTKEFPLEREMLTLGREPGNDIVVDERVVSRRHAQLQRVAPDYEITDLGSANGLTWQGARVPKKLLTNGDVLWIADTVSLTYQTGEAIPLAEEPVVSQTLDLREHAVFTIGRDAQNDVTLDHPAISRLHARIVRRDTQFVIEDAGSNSGTFVNGVRVGRGEWRALQPGDTIRVGPIKFVFAPEALEKTDESRDLRLDALHLNQFVSQRVNLLQDISLSIKPREFVAIVGVSGAGKSTLLDGLTGFRPASQGTVLVNGTDLYRNFDAFRTSIGYVPQDDIIHRELTVEQALDYAARLRLPADTSVVERERRVTQVLETLNLAERKTVPIQKLSGGQRKRVSIGVELLTQPGLFFLDEATSGLDPGTESQLMRLLRKLADEGHTILLVTHATKNVMLCDQVAFLAKGGHLAYYGPPEEALQYFGVQDFDAIYQKLESEQTPQTWDENYRQSPQFQKYVVERLQDKYGALITPTPVSSPTKQERARMGVGVLRQFWILSARYLNIIRRDRINLLLLLLIAPILGSIDLIAWPRRLFDLHDGDAARAMTFLFLSAIVPFLVGALSSVREIVKEAPVYKRERTVTLKIAPYLLSKVWVGLLFALYHAAALLAIKLVAVDFSYLSTENIARFYVTLALAAMSGVLWGLLISALAPREEQAMLLVIVVVVAQIFFSGGILPLSQLSDAGQVLGGITSSRWTFQALATATQVKTGACEGAALSDCHLPGLAAYATDAEKRVLLRTINERFSDVFGADIYAAWGALVVIMVVLYALLFILQKRKDVI
jgi:ABC-type multidrug transport system ATPase subunit/pSer/pThr/pTyr-binding forkhead associated (FHA) protein